MNTDGPSPTELMARWRDKAQAELAGAPLDKLTTALPGGLRAEPVYAGPAADPGLPGAPPYTRGARADDAHWWRTTLVLAGETPPVDLAPHVDGVWLEGAGAERLAGLDPTGLLVAAEEAPHAHLDALGDRRPGALVLGGAPDAELPALIARVEREGRTEARVVLVSTRELHQRGAHAALELGAALWMAAERLRALAAAGVEVARAAPRFAFALAVGRDVFLEVAKLRAARLCWAKLLAACGEAAPPPMWIHAETSRRMLAARDPWVNLLRVTTATFSAAVGGADSVTSVPFDLPLGEPDALGRRMARNTSRALAEEGHLGEVIDPAGGSYLVEALTQDLARAAWRELGALERGASLDARLEEEWARVRADVARRKYPVLGVSEFADADEAPLPRAPRPPDVGHRDGEAFEALRARADRARPAVYLATLGPLAEHGPREAFARNLFGAAGARVTSDLGTAGPADHAALAARFAASGARVACLCGADPRYAAEAADAARALVAAGASRVYLAGRPGEREAAWRAAGVHEFVFIGVDVAALLGDLLDHLGVK